MRKDNLDSNKIYQKEQKFRIEFDVYIKYQDELKFDRYDYPKIDELFLDGSEIVEANHDFVYHKYPIFKKKNEG